MRHLLTIVTLLLTFSLHAQLVEIQPDSIYASFDVVKNERYIKVYKDGEFDNQYLEASKAEARMHVLRINNPESEISRVVPTARPEGDLKIFIDASKLTSSDNSEFLERLQIVETQNEIQSETISNLLAEINYIKTRDSLIFITLENRINTLQTFLKDSITFIMETPIDYSLPIVKGFSHDTTGWLIDEEEQSFTYQNTMDYRYIVFNFNRPLIVGQTYVLTFDVITNGNALFDIWFYPKDNAILPEEFVSGRVTEQITQEEGTYRLYYTVQDIDRSSLGIRAKINDLFIVSNVKILKEN